jgi:NAD(P)H-hydrate repair Nnr-like enzyme with NAD(P)H-hydrate epimerase domain
VLADEQFELALEFLLLVGVGENGFDGAVVECAAL